MKFLIFEKFPELKYGFSERADGAMELSRKILEGVEPENRKKFFQKLGIPYERTVATVLAHETDIQIVANDDAGKIFKGVDGFITAEKNLFLTITGSDCFPVYFFDPIGKRIALIHAGWRGVAKNIVSKAVKKLIENGAKTEDLLVGIGPGIQVCHFDVIDVIPESALYDKMVEHHGKKFVNLSAIIEKQVMSLGIVKAHIENSRECTYCLKDKYFSYRRDKPVEVEPMIAYIGKEKKNMIASKKDLEKKRKLGELILKELRRLHPDAKIALKYGNNMQLLAAVILSAQCTDKKVNEVTEELFKKYRTVDDFADANIAEFEKEIYQTGFYHAKAKNIISAAKMIRKEFGGEIPKTMPEILRLPGVARKTANVVLGNAYGVVEGIAVDTHVKRLSKLYGLTNETDPVKIEKDLMQIIPKKDWFGFTYMLIDYGRKECPARPHNHMACPLVRIKV